MEVKAEVEIVPPVKQEQSESNQNQNNSREQGNNFGGPRRGGRGGSRFSGGRGGFQNVSVFPHFCKYILGIIKNPSL